jgi:hypothetical protein
MSAKHYVGTPRKFQFWTYKETYVAGVLAPALFDAPVTKFSFVNTTTGTEETLTYGGTALYDLQLTRISVGYFELWFTFATVGIWNYNAEWSETISGQTVTVKGPTGSIRIEADPFTWADIPVVTP